MTTYKKIILAFVICAMGVVGVQWMRKSQEAARPKEKAPTPVEVAQAKSDAIIRRLTVSGTLSAVQSVKLHPQTSGKIVKIYAEEGQLVQKGDPLFKLDDSLTKAKLKEAQANLAFKKEEYSRAVKLVEKKFGSLQLRDKNLAEMQQAEANAEEAQVRQDHTLILAPFTGFLGLHEVSVGSYVSEQQPIATIVDLDPINVDFALAESHLPFIHVGDPVDVTIEDFDILPVEAKIVAISPEIDETTHTIQIRAQLPNKENAYRPGEYAKVVVVAGSVADAVIIPTICLQRRGETEYVFTVANNVVTETTVSVGLREGANVQITHGVKPGEFVVSAGQFKLHDGDVVKIANAPTASTGPAKK